MDLGLAVDGGRAEDVSLHHISVFGTSFEDDLVDVAVEG